MPVDAPFFIANSEGSMVPGKVIVPALASIVGGPYGQIAEGALLGLVVALVSIRIGFLSHSGAFGAFLLACVVWGIGGLEWTAPLFAFFVLSSLLSVPGRRKQAVQEGMHEKSGARDFWQVMANGGLAGAVMVCGLLFPGALWKPAFLGSIAAVCADTWSTEIGMLSPRMPRSILTMRQVPHGSSGGISVLGTVGGLLGAALIAFIGFASHVTHITYGAFVSVVAGGAAGNLADSLAGALFQARYSCAVCGTGTERRMHCGEPAVLAGGYRCMTNDVVNFICSAAGAAISALVFNSIQ
jgi:uncharacterized protein (TIGR00297 family)